MLDQVEIFDGLGPDDLATLEQSSSSQTYPKNTVVIQRMSLLTRSMSSSLVG